MQGEICLLDSTDHKIKLVYFCQLNSVAFDLGEYGAMPEKADEIEQIYSASQQAAGELGGTLCSHQHCFLLGKIRALSILEAQNKCALLGGCDSYSW